MLPFLNQPFLNVFELLFLLSPTLPTSTPSVTDICVGIGSIIFLALQDCLHIHTEGFCYCFCYWDILHLAFLNLMSWKCPYITDFIIIIFFIIFTSSLIFYCCSSVAQLCPSLCDSMDFSMPGFPVHLLQLAQTHVHWVSGAIQPSCPLSSPSYSYL